MGIDHLKSMTLGTSTNILASESPYAFQCLLANYFYKMPIQASS